MSADTPKIQYQKEVEVREESFGETRCMKPQKPKTKIQIQMENRKKYTDISRMNCLIGYRNSERVWSMKVLQHSLGRNPEQRSQDTSKPPHELPLEPRAKVEPGSGEHSVFSLTFRRTRIVKYVYEDENNKGFWQKTCWHRRAQSGTFW